MYHPLPCLSNLENRICTARNWHLTPQPNRCIIYYVVTKQKRKETPVNEFITTTEAAAELGITRPYVDILIARGVLEARKVNNRLWLVNRASLANWTPKRKRREKLIE